MDRAILTELTCPHCRAILSKPVTMPCGHHVCSACLHTLSEGRGKLNCPQCLSQVAVAKCIANPLMEKVILELSAPRATEQAAGPLPFPSAQHQSHVSWQEGQGIQVQYPGPAISGKTQQQGSDRLVLTHNQRQYIRYVVVTDPDTGIKYTVGIKHVLNSAGSTQLVQVLERNIGSEYKKGSSKRVCKSVVHGGPCALNTECPFIHVTPEGWEARRKFSSANQKRNKDAGALGDGSPLMPGAAGLPHPSLPHGPLDPAEMGLPAAWAGSQARGWVAPMHPFPHPAAAPFAGPGVFGAPTHLLQHRPPHSVEHLLPPFHHDGPGETAGSSQSSTPRDPKSDLSRLPDAPMLPTPFPFPLPIFSDFHLGAPGFDRGDLHGGHRDPRLGGGLGRLSAMSAASSMSASSSGPGASSSSASPLDARNPQDSSAASTSSSIGAISSVSSSGSHGSPLASPLIESIATAELPELLPEKATDYAEESRMIPYFNKANNLWKPFP